MARKDAEQVDGVSSPEIAIGRELGVARNSKLLYPKENNPRTSTLLVVKISGVWRAQEDQRQGTIRIVVDAFTRY